MCNWSLRLRREGAVEEVLEELMARICKLQVMNIKNEREVTGIDPTDIIKITKDCFLPSFLLHVHKFDILDEK